MKRIEIAGGGLAGLVLGIGLRNRGVPVRIIESGHYPRGRVCGEMISGKGLGVLEREGLKDLLLDRGARPVATMKFVAGNGAEAIGELSEPGLAFPRVQLDDLLARTFRQAGGELIEGKRFHGEALAEGMVRATGRRVRAQINGWRYFGLKAHVRGVVMEADLEMYLVEQGYVGLCRLEEDLVNVCGLFRSGGDRAPVGGDWSEWIKGPVEGPLEKKLRHAHFEPDTFCSIAGLPADPAPVQSLDEWRIGDCLTMIPPVTGNGMSMAFESASLALPWLCQFSRGELAWEEAMRGFNSGCACEFERRIWWARILHRALFGSASRKLLIAGVAMFPRVLNFFHGLTR